MSNPNHSHSHSGARGGYARVPALIPNPLEGRVVRDVRQVEAMEREKARQERAMQGARQERERSKPRREGLHSNGEGEGEGPTREHLRKKSKSRSKRRGSRSYRPDRGNENSGSNSGSSGRRKPGTRKNTAVSAAPVPPVFSVSSGNEVMFVKEVNTAAEKAAAEAAEKEKRRAAKAKENARRKAIQNAQNARNSQIVKGSPFGTMRFGNNVNTWR